MEDDYNVAEFSKPETDFDYFKIVQALKSRNTNVFVKTDPKEVEELTEVVSNDKEMVTELYSEMNEFFLSTPVFLDHLGKWIDVFNRRVAIAYPTVGMSTYPVEHVLRLLSRIHGFVSRCLRGKYERDFDGPEFQAYLKRLNEANRFAYNNINRLLKTQDICSVEHYLKLFKQVSPVYEQLAAETFSTWKKPFEKHRQKRLDDYNRAKSKRSYHAKKARSNSKDSVDKIAKK